MAILVLVIMKTALLAIMGAAMEEAMRLLTVAHRAMAELLVAEVAVAIVPA